jgi:hypothetical protein
MKHPSECTKQELVAVVSGIQCALYLDDGVWNPDKDWSPDTLDKKNRMAGRMDRIRCNNGKFTYECVWTKADQGEPCCIFGMNIYDWNRLGPAHLPQRSW